jgi:hypothetical protein
MVEDDEGPLASSLVERVAEALATNDNPGKHWITLDGVSKEIYRKLARAAIEAIRQPPEEMLAAHD